MDFLKIVFAMNTSLNPDLVFYGHVSCARIRKVRTLRSNGSVGEDVTGSEGHHARAPQDGGCLQAPRLTQQLRGPPGRPVSPPRALLHHTRCLGNCTILEGQPCPGCNNQGKGELWRKAQIRRDRPWGAGGPGSPLNKTYVLIWWRAILLSDLIPAAFRKEGKSQKKPLRHKSWGVGVRVRSALVFFPPLPPPFPPSPLLSPPPTVHDRTTFTWLFGLASGIHSLLTR